MCLGNVKHRLTKGDTNTSNKMYSKETNIKACSKVLGDERIITMSNSRYKTRRIPTRDEH
jgi:hypothetical protein